MRKLIKFSLATIIVLSSFSTIAQQLPQFTQYMYNTISINPAYAGSRETLSIVALHRNQWAGFSDAPKTTTLSIHSPLRNEKVGLGFSFIQDNLLDNFSYVYGDFSYTLKLSDKTKLALGLKGGFTHYGLDDELRQDPGVNQDPTIGNISDQWNPNIGVGSYLHTNRWYLGISVPRLFRNDYNDQGNVEVLERLGYYFTGGYVFDLNKSTKFKPSVLVKATNGAPLSYDLSANFLFNEKFWLGAAYRIDTNSGALAAITDYQISKQLRIGYTFEYSTTDLNKYSDGTHEFLLMFELFKAKRVKSPRYF